MDGDIDSGNWSELRAAAVAVNELCVEKGKAGAAFGLGELILSFASKEDC